MMRQSYGRAAARPYRGIATGDCKLTSVGKWLQGARFAGRVQKFSGVSRCSREMARIPCIYNGFSALQLLAGALEQGDLVDFSTGGAMEMSMKTSESVTGGGNTSPAVAPPVVGSHLNRSTKTVQQIYETHRSRLYELMVNADYGIRSEELELHFASMPLRYWPRVDGESLRWHLEIIHEFMDGLAHSDVLLAPPVMHWRHFPDRGFSEVVVCTWDRLGLLAKIAGAFAATGLNILRADIYTRSDNIVLDVFQVCDEELRHVEDISRLKQMEQLLAVAFSPNGGGDAVLRTWMQCAGAPDRGVGGKVPALTFDNDRFDDYTVLQVEAPDRVGLLHDILEAISTCDVDIVHAVIVTEEDEAADVFFMTGTDGRKIRDATRLEQIRDAVRAALG
jgi:UTP:GlnB (protein PII) uridylyltransferase